MRFYAACLAAYNNGKLHGRWIDASSDEDAMMNEIKDMLAKSPEPDAEEWAIHDTEGLPSSIGEYSGLKPIAEYAELAEDFHEIDEEDLREIVSDFESITAAREALTDRYNGIYATFQDYADEFADEMMAAESCQKESYASRYFDYEAHARDLQMDMRTIDIPSGVAVFYN